MTSKIQTRRCIGSNRFGIEAHEADAGDFPVRPSQKDGLGRMCKLHWRVYTNALREAAVARKATVGTAVPFPDPGPEVVETVVELPAEPEPTAPRRTRGAKTPAGSTGEGDAA
jgi:hypothetical protein